MCGSVLAPTPDLVEAAYLRDTRKQQRCGPIHCLIVDDEPHASVLLKSHIEKTPFLSLMGTFQSPIAALSFLQKEAIELIFLDLSDFTPKKSRLRRENIIFCVFRTPAALFTKMFAPVARNFYFC